MYLLHFYPYFKKQSLAANVTNSNIQLIQNLTIQNWYPISDLCMAWINQSGTAHDLAWPTHFWSSLTHLLNFNPRLHSKSKIFKFAQKCFVIGQTAVWLVLHDISRFHKFHIQEWKFCSEGQEKQAGVKSAKWAWLKNQQPDREAGLADLNQCDLSHWFKSQFKSIDFFTKNQVT